MDGKLFEQVLNIPNRIHVIREESESLKFRGKQIRWEVTWLLLSCTDKNIQQKLFLLSSIKILWTTNKKTLDNQWLCSINYFSSYSVISKYTAVLQWQAENGLQHPTLQISIYTAHLTSKINCKHDTITLDKSCCFFKKLLFTQNEVTLHSPFWAGLFFNAPPPANLSLHIT